MTKKNTLNKDQVFGLVASNKYPPSEKTKFLSRCIDGRYQNEKGLPALATPGGDLGELALILATAQAFGFEIDEERALRVLIEVVGGEENFHFHTDEHHIKEDRCRVSRFREAFPPNTSPTLKSSKQISLSRSDLAWQQLDWLSLNGCDHWRQIKSDPAAYHLREKEIKFIEKTIFRAVASNTLQPVMLKGEHREGAILMVKGGLGVYPQYQLATDQGKKLVEVFVYHQSFVDTRHRLLAKKLVEDKAVKLYPGVDEEYLYEVLSDEAENHLFETAKRLAQSLPVYLVEFDESGNFKVEDMGVIS